jgi:serine/threonine protein kinase
VLVLEDLGGEPLERFVGKPMELQQFLCLAIGLSAALRQVHQHGLIHKDVKPANALLPNERTAISMTIRSDCGAIIPHDLNRAAIGDQCDRPNREPASANTRRMIAGLDAAAVLASLLERSWHPSSRSARPLSSIR